MRERLEVTSVTGSGQNQQLLHAQKAEVFLSAVNLGDALNAVAMGTAHARVRGKAKQR